MADQYTIPAGRYSDTSAAFIQAYIDQEIAKVIDLAPETLNSLNELAAAIGDDPAFFSSMTSANTTLQTNIDNLSTAAASARTTLQTLLQNAVDAVQADVDTNETTAASAVAAEASARATALTNLQTTLQGLIDAVQADVDANELASDNAETALSGRLDTLEADPTTATALAAVQADVDANETASDAAETALSGRLDTLEVDPTTATAVAAVQTDVDANEASRKTYFAWESNLSKVINPVRGSRIDVGNNITFYPAAGYNTEIKGNLTTDNTTKVFFTLTDAANDSAAATAGIDVGQLYRNGSVVMIRVS